MKSRYSYDFELSDYEDYGQEPNVEHISENEYVQLEKTNAKQKRDNDFNLSEYEEYTPPVESEDKIYEQYKVSEKTPEELKKMSLQERYDYAQELLREREYLQSAGFTKGALSGATLGLSEKIPLLKQKENELITGLGEFAGATLPIGLTSKALSIPFKMSGLMNYTSGKIAQSATTGALYNTGKQAVKGEGINPLEVAVEATFFGGLHALIEGIPIAYNWLKTLNHKQQAQILTEGVIPKDLTPNQYKVYETEIVPELKKVGQEKYQEALHKAVEENEKDFALKMQNIKAEHENDLYRRSQKQQLNEKEYQEAQDLYKNKLKQVAMEHEEKIAEIQKQNKFAVDQFNEDLKSFEDMKERQRIVNDTLGENFSPNKIESYREAGQNNVDAIRANDAYDYNKVREAYSKSEKLNSQVTVIQPNLVQDLKSMKAKLDVVPKLSPPQEQMLNVIDSLLNDIAIYNENGSIIGFKPINNNVLEEQAKALRYFMDFNFEHGNTRGIFQPLVNKIEDAIELGANFVNNIEAADANKQARLLYRQWAKEYDNDYIRPFRDTTNEDYNKLFYSILDPDNFLVIDKILQKSNAGQQISKMNKRAFVEKNFHQFVEHPGKINTKAFEEELKKARGVINEGEEEDIKYLLSELSEVKEPKKPEIKELPKAKIPLLKEKLKKVPSIEKVNIPLKPKVKTTPEMKAAEKIMKITPEQAKNMTNTRSGLKELKENLPDKLFEKIAKHKVKEILQKGKIQKKFTGKDLYEVINEGENYEILSEILGEEKTAELLVNSNEIASKQITVDAFKKVGTKLGTIKTLIIFGIL